MANQWLRLWHDMPNDPKWRTIARLSQQPISLVQAVYLHLLVDASRNVTRGHVDVTNEDLASALDVTEEAISAIREAMQNRVLNDDTLSGWEARQPAREDSGDRESGAKSSTERKREERARKAAGPNNGEKSRNVTTSHDVSRNVTTDKDKDKDKEIPLNPQRDDLFERFWKVYPRHTAKQNARQAWSKLKLTANDPRLDAMRQGLAVAKQSHDWVKDKGQFIPHAATWLNGQRWHDELTPANVIPIGGMEARNESKGLAL